MDERLWDDTTWYGVVWFELTLMIYDMGEWCVCVRKKQESVLHRE